MRRIDGPLLRRLAARYGTPFYLYRAELIRQRITSLRDFEVIRFAQKACSNLHILRLMRSEGVLVDAVSAGEIRRALQAGYSGRSDPPGLVFTADVFTHEALELVVDREIPVNAGSTDMLRQLGARSPGHRVWLRVNPGFGHGHHRKVRTGGEWSKHGIWHERMAEALATIRREGLRLSGLHMHLGSGGQLSTLNRTRTAMLREAAALGPEIRTISVGGGLPIPYEPDAAPFDVKVFFSKWAETRERIRKMLGHAVRLEVEPGRYLVAEAGWLVAEVRATKRTGSNRFVLVDAGFDNLPRPALYGSYHGIRLVRRDGEVAERPVRPTVVAGPLCESGDVFTQDETGAVVPRALPEAEVGDLLVFLDAGAYAATMASNYNSRPFAPEILADGSDIRLIRRRQTMSDLLALEESPAGAHGDRSEPSASAGRQRP